jgi:hypothetical protein
MLCSRSQMETSTFLRICHIYLIIPFSKSQELRWLSPGSAATIGSRSLSAYTSFAECASSRLHLNNTVVLFLRSCARVVEYSQCHNRR